MLSDKAPRRFSFATAGIFKLVVTESRNEKYRERQFPIPKEADCITQPTASLQVCGPARPSTQPSDGAGSLYALPKLDVVSASS